MTAQQDVIDYIKQQAGDPFTGATGLDGFQLQISNALFASEAGLPGVPYRLSHAVVGRSSFSFGAAQWDVGAFETMNPPQSESNIVVVDSQINTNASVGISMLEQILRNAVDGTGSRIVSDDQVREIINRLGITGELARNNPLALGPVITDPVTQQQSVPLLDLVNRALNSAFGKNQINIWHGQHMADLEAHVMFVNQSVVDPARRTFLEGSTALQLFLADIRNQIDPTFSRTRLVEYLNSTGAAPVSVGTARLAVTGDSLDTDDVLNYYFGLPLNNPGINDRLRRINNDVRVAGGFSLSADLAAREEEAKGLIRVYQDFLKGRVSSSDFNTFNANVLELARVALIGKYVFEPGLGISIDGEVVVGEDTTSHQRNTKHSSEHDFLVGTDINDLIFGESGNDVLTGGLGDDVLRGGDGVDIYQYRPGDGNDIIVDSDGRGLIRFGTAGQEQGLALGIRQSTDPAGQYQSPDGTITYQLNGTTLTISTPDGGVITVKDFNPDRNDLHIHLIDQPPFPAGNVLTLNGTALSDADFLDNGVPAAVAGGGVLNKNWLNYNALGTLQSATELGGAGGLWHFARPADDPRVFHIINGNDGHDFLLGNPGGTNIRLDGGIGNDWLIADYNFEWTDFRSITDYTLPAPGATLLGGAGHDAILGGLRADWIEAGSGHDQVIADPDTDVGTGNGKDYIDGGTGNGSTRGHDIILHTDFPVSTRWTPAINSIRLAA